MKNKFLLFIRRRKGFTLIELMIVMITIAIIAAVIFLAVNPAKRIGDAQNAIRDQNALELKNGLERLIADSLTVPDVIGDLNINEEYMLVTDGGSTAGTCSCTTLNKDISRIDLSGLLNSYVPSLPVDSSASGDDTGYYIKKIASSGFQTGSCYEYTGTTESVSVPVELVAGSEGPSASGTVSSVAGDGSNWSFPNNVKINDGITSSANTDDWDYTSVESEVKIVKSDGSIGTTNQASLAVWGQIANPGYTVYGSAYDLWGETWTATDINDPDFGVVLKVANQVWGTQYLKMTNFSFAIPEGAVIDGIKVEIERWRVVDAGEDWVTVTHHVDHARMTIYYRS